MLGPFCKKIFSNNGVNNESSVGKSIYSSRILWDNTNNNDTSFQLYQILFKNLEKSSRRFGDGAKSQLFLFDEILLTLGISNPSLIDYKKRVRLSRCFSFLLQTMKKLWPVISEGMVNAQIWTKQEHVSKEWVIPICSAVILPEICYMNDYSFLLSILVRSFYLLHFFFCSYFHVFL
jgi:hypothetical protein